MVPRVPLATTTPRQPREPLRHLRPSLVVIPVEDRCYLCPLCGRICHGVEASAVHAGAEHTDATELTYLDLDDPKHMPDDPGQSY